MKNNRMKKAALVLTFVLICSCAFASMQQFYKHNEEVRILEDICRDNGVAMPAFIYPVSGDSLVYFIDHSGLNQKLDSESLKTLNNLKAVFSGDALKFRMSDDFAFNADITLAPAFFYTNEKIDHKEVSVKSDDVDWILSDNEIPDFLLAGADIKMSKYAFGHFEYGLTADPLYLHRNQFEHNVMIMPLSKKVLKYGESVNKEREGNGPYHAYLAVGTQNIGLAIGRMRASSSNGITGNLGVGDNFMFRDSAIFTINAWPFTYQYMLNRFDPEGAGNDYHTNASGVELPWVTMHKASFNLLDNHLNVGLYEGVLTYSIFEPRVLSPFILMHNLLTYRNGNENNFFGFEADVTLGMGLDFHLQAQFDQIQLKGETSDKPNAFGLLTNAKYTTKVGSGYLTCFAEGVYTNPWLYLKAESDDYATDSQKKEYYKYDLYTGNYFGGLWQSNTHNDNSNVLSYQDSAFIGYKYGPNVIVADAGVVYRLPDNVCSADVLIKIAGSHYEKALGGKHSTPCVYTGAKAEKLLQIRVQDSIKFFNGGLSLTGIAAYQHYSNYKNVENENHNDIQTMVSVCFRPLEFIKTK